MSSQQVPARGPATAVEPSRVGGPATAAEPSRVGGPGTAVEPGPVGRPATAVEPGPVGPATPGPDWDRLWEKALTLLPWALLIPATAVSQLAPDQTYADRTLTLSLVGLTAAWVYLGHTRRPSSKRARTAPMTIYFAGLLVMCVVLMTRDPAFILFTITGFFHAFCLKPWQLGVAGVFGTSVALNTMAQGFPAATAEAIGMYAGIIAIQTVAIGAGVLFSEKGLEYTRQRELMVARLEEALEENAGLHAQLLTQAREAGVLDERQRMAREIHDTLAQGLTGIITQAQAAQRMWDSPQRARPHLDRALELARDSLTEARRSVRAMQPRELDGAQLPDALRDLARRWAEGTGIQPRIDVTGSQVPLSPALEVALFRVAQEALTNVTKHARASRVGVTLSYLDDTVLLDVRDDGVGTVYEAGQLGFGLTSMRQRIRSVGGTVEIESTPGDGTAICASVPAIAAQEAR